MSVSVTDVIITAAKKVPSCEDIVGSFDSACYRLNYEPLKTG